MLAIKPGQRNMLMAHLTPQNKWWMHSHGTQTIGGHWQTKGDDIYVTGDFDGDGIDELLAANPDGRYQTLEVDSLGNIN